MQSAWSEPEDWLLLGGGSNVVIGDDGFDGVVVPLSLLVREAQKVTAIEAEAKASGAEEKETHDKAKAYDRMVASSEQRAAKRARTD